MPNHDPAFAWPFRNGPARVGSQGLFRPCLKTFVGIFVLARLTAAGSPRMRKITKIQEDSAEISLMGHKRAFNLEYKLWLGVTSDLLLIKNYPTSYLYGAPLLKIQFDRFVSIPKVQKSLRPKSNPVLSWSHFSTIRTKTTLSEIFLRTFLKAYFGSWFQLCDWVNWFVLAVIKIHGSSHKRTPSGLEKWCL